MIKTKTFASLVLAAFFVVFGTARSAQAAEVPSLSLYPTVGSSVVQATVIDADPNVSILLHYPANGSVQTANIGTSNTIGYLNTTIDSVTYGIAAGSQVYVTADGAASPSSVWPSYTSSGGLSLSQGSLSILVGNNSVVTAATSATLSVASNSNPSVASANISGNQINISGLAAGLTNVSVCAVNIGCGTVAVTVSSSGSSVPSSLYLSQNNISVTAGQNQTVAISGSGNYFVSSNSNPGIASANISGANLSVIGISAGSTNVSVCSSGSDGSSTCVPITISVLAAAISTASTQAVPTFSQSQVSLSVGQSQTIAVYGSAPFTVSGNSGPDAVSASISGSNSVTLYGLAAGGSNISICEFSSGGCANLYAYVAPQGSAPAQSVGAPALSSISISSSGANGLASAGNTATITFSMNQTVSTPTVTVAGSRVNVSGTGSGPYTASYTMIGNESQPIQIAMTFLNTSGLGGQASFTLAAPSSAIAAATTGSGTTNFSFTSYLSPGSTGAEVTALQTVLGRLGFLNVAANGTYGPATTAAVEAFQSAHGIDSLGVVGPSTRSLLNSLLTTGTVAAASDGYVFNKQLTTGSTGADVTELQKRLTALGVYSGPITGDYESLTAAAVKAYQKLHSLDQLGVVGPSTREALNAGN